jgi:hypothetical protein
LRADPAQCGEKTLAKSDKLEGKIMPDDLTPTGADRERDLRSDLYHLGRLVDAGALHMVTAGVSRAAIRRALAAEAELVRLRAALEGYAARAETSGLRHFAEEMRECAKGE